MKRTCITRLAAGGLLWVAFAATGCAFTDYGNRINAQRDSIETLERKREELESRYVMVLNNLERFPGDRTLELERDAVRQRILECNTRIADQRRLYDAALQEWERKITDDKLQKEILDRAERKAADQDAQQQ